MQTITVFRMTEKPWQVAQESRKLARAHGVQKNNFHCTVFEISFCTSILNHVFSLRKTTFHIQNDGKMTTKVVYEKSSGIKFELTLKTGQLRERASYLFLGYF